MNHQIRKNYNENSYYNNQNKNYHQPIMMQNQKHHVTSQNMTSLSSTPKKPRKVEIVRVCLVKNPTFGIHVHDSGEFMGESGVLIMRVQKGGSAEGKVRVGDKILMVNGTNILGMQHNKAVELLRNCGKIANFVLERKIY